MGRLRWLSSTPPAVRYLGSNSAWASRRPRWHSRGYAGSHRHRGLPLSPPPSFLIYSLSAPHHSPPLRFSLFFGPTRASDLSTPAPPSPSRCFFSSLSPIHLEFLPFPSSSPSSFHLTLPPSGDGTRRIVGRWPSGETYGRPAVPVESPPAGSRPRGQLRIVLRLQRYDGNTWITQRGKYSAPRPVNANWTGLRLAEDWRLRSAAEAVPPQREGKTMTGPHGTPPTWLRAGRNGPAS